MKNDIIDIWLLLLCFVSFAMFAKDGSISYTMAQTNYVLNCGCFILFIAINKNKTIEYIHNMNTLIYFIQFCKGNVSTEKQ